MGSEQVTIAIPTYNEEPYLRRAIDSALSQNAMVLVTDNCSTDGTQAICEEYARCSPSFSYVRHAANLGASRNFRFGMHAARSPYFMWLGAHDALPAGYVEALGEALEGEPDAALAYGSVQYMDAQGNMGSRYDYYFSDKLASGDPFVRLRAIAGHLTDCALVHGLFRRERLLEAWIDEVFPGGDHVVLARAAMQARFIYRPRVQYLRRAIRGETSADERMRRMEPDGGTAGGHRMMISHELALLDRVPDASWLKRKYQRALAGLMLLKRFGPWSPEGTAWRLIQEAAWRAILLLARSRQFCRSRLALLQR